MYSSNISFHSNINIYNAGPEKVDTFFLEKIRDWKALKKIEALYGLNSPEYYFRLEQLRIIKKSSYCGYLRRDPCWGPVKINGRVEMQCKCVYPECEDFEKCITSFGLMEFDFDIEDIERFSPEDRFLSDEYDYEVYKDRVLFPIESDTEIPGGYYGSKPGIYQSDVKKDKLETEETVIPINPFSIVNKIKSEELIAAEEDDDNEFQDADNELFDSFSESPLNIFAELKCVEQDEIITSDVSRNIFVDAGPGTGKTYTLIEKINFLVCEAGINPNTIQVLSFTNAAVDEIKARLDKSVIEGADRGLRNVDVRTFHKMAWLLLGYANENYTDLGWEPVDLSFDNNYEESILQAADLINRFPDIILQWKHFVVDEVQDLTGNKALFVLSIIRACMDNGCGFSILGDSCQAIYDYVKKFDKSAITSDKFYHDLYKTIMGQSDFVYLEKNHRQSEELIELTSDLRKAILQKSRDRISEAVQKLDNNISELDKTALIMDADYVGQLNNGKRLSFLCRNNGQTLRLSTLFRKRGISHVLNTNEVRDNFAPWIAYLFAEYEETTISFETFVKRVQEKDINFNGLELEFVWNSMKRVINTNTGIINILDFLEALKQSRIYDPLFRTTPSDKVTISTIHRAKGREYDAVVLDKSFVEDVQSTRKDIGEYKTLYVAITRPKESLNTCRLSFEIIKKATHNVYQKRWYTKPYGKLVHIEIGSDNDVNRTEFIGKRPDLIQNYITNNVKPGDEIKLRRIRSKAGLDYEILHFIEDTEMCLGRMNSSFINDLRKLLRVKSNVEYPAYIEDLFVESIYTYIAGSESIAKYPEIIRFSKFGIWNWVNFNGLGHLIYDTY